MDYVQDTLNTPQFKPHVDQKHPVYQEVMSAQVTVGNLSVRATNAIYITASAGMKWRNALRLVHQASDTIKMV